MVIALNEVADESFLARLAILVVVAIVITILVYGVVALIVKMDDVGLALTQRSARVAQRVGHFLVGLMPRLLAVLSTVGIAAMIWVGGHILLVGSDEVGWHPPYDLVHDLEHEAQHALEDIGSLVGWLVNTGCSLLIGLVVGAIVVAILQVLPFGKKKAHPAGH